MEGSISPDVGVPGMRQVAAIVRPTMGYDALPPVERAAVRRNQDVNSPAFAQYLDSFRGTWDSHPATCSTLRNHLGETAGGNRDNVAHNDALVNMTDLLQEGVRRHFRDNGLNFSPDEANRIANQLDQRLETGANDAFGFKDVAMIVNECKTQSDYSSPATVADRLDGFAAVQLARGKIDSALSAIEEAQRQRGMPVDLDAGDWLPRISQARTPVGLDSSSFNFGDRNTNFGRAMKAKGYEFYYEGSVPFPQWSQPAQVRRIQK